MQRQIGFSASICLLFAAGILFGSCTKCVKCKEYRKGSVSQLPAYDFPEECGTKTQMTEYESYRESQVDPGNELKCTVR